MIESSVQNDPEASEDPVHDQLPSVEEIRMTAAAQLKSVDARRNAHRSGGRKDPRKAVMVLIVVMLVTVIAISVGLSRSNRQSTATSELNQPAPSAAPSPIPSRYSEVIDFLIEQGISDEIKLRGSSGPHFLAVRWLADEDPLSLPIPSSILEPKGREFLSRYVLVLLYYSLNGPRWKRKLRFLSDASFCQWNEVYTSMEHNFNLIGVTCNNNQEVAELQIPGNLLRGNIPSEIRYLTELTLFALNNNEINGPLPDGFEQLTKLTYLAMHYNNMTSTIPSWLGTFTDLVTLGLSNNNLVGTIPSEFANLTALATLGLDDNELTGNIRNLQGLRSMKRLYLEDNEFNDKLDNSSFILMRSLEALDISGNEFSGTVPDHFFQFQNLTVMDLGNNNIEGTIPITIPMNPTLQYIGLKLNLLKGTIPTSISNVRAATHLDLYGNGLNGTIPSEIGMMTNLTYLYLANNEFDDGPIPRWLGSLMRLKELSLRRTQRTGAIPSMLLTMKTLVLLDLSKNSLTGMIPTVFGYFQDLRFLMLNHNNLNGTIPSELGPLSRLNLILLNNNSLSGNADAVCDRSVHPNIFLADCAGDSPELDCRCCTSCCEKTDAQSGCVDDAYIGDLDPIWETSFDRAYYQFNAEIIYDGN